MLRDVSGYTISFSFIRPLCLLRMSCYMRFAAVVQRSRNSTLIPLSNISVPEKCFQKQMSQLWSLRKSNLKYSSVVKTLMAIVLYFVCLQTTVLNSLLAVLCLGFMSAVIWLRRGEARATEGCRQLWRETTVERS